MILYAKNLLFGLHIEESIPLLQIRNVMRMANEKGMYRDLYEDVSSSNLPPSFSSNFFRSSALPDDEESSTLSGIWSIVSDIEEAPR